MKSILRWILPAFAFSVAGSLIARQPIDTRGPVTNTGMTVVANPRGIQAPGYKWTPPLALDSWQGHWIGVQGHAAPNGSAVLLRKEVTLESDPKSVIAYMTAKDYILYVNGHQAARGPADPGHDFTGTPSGRFFYDPVDLASLIHKGSNVIAAEILSGGGFLFEAHVKFADGKTQTLASDDTWRGTSCSFLTQPNMAADPSLQLTAGRHFLFDAAQEPIGWQAPGFDDSAWPICVTGAPPANLTLSELPPLMEACYPAFEVTDVHGGAAIPAIPFSPGQPIKITSDSSFSIHYSRIMAGRCGIRVVGKKGTTICLRSTEIGEPGGRAYVIKLREGLQYFESPDYYALGTLCVSIAKVTGPIEIQDISAIAVSQPVFYDGAFACSDDYLNRLWLSGRWSTQICMQTRHLDSPQHQEPICDYGDYVIEDLVNDYAMGNDQWLARQDLRKFAWVMQAAGYQTFHTSYTLLWLQALLNYYDFTGDKSLIAELAPEVNGLMDRFTSYIGKNGIISEAPNYMFMDWVAVAGIACHHPPAVIGQGYMTAFFYKGLADALRVANLTGDTARAAKYTQLRNQVAAAYNRELWDPAKGLYRDGKPFVTSVKPGRWLPADTNIETFSIQNNALAVLYDLAPPDAQAGIIRKIMATKPWNVTPYFMHFVLSAVAHAGLFSDYGTAWMRTWKIDPQTETVREMGDKGDHSHGWIATPTYQMSSRILGVTPASPALESVIIQPALCDLAWARGKVPTPRGPIDVSWSRESDGLKMEVTLPAGISPSKLDIPIGTPAAASLTVNGQTLWNRGIPGLPGGGVLGIAAKDDCIELTLAPGDYQCEASLPKAAAR